MAIFIVIGDGHNDYEIKAAGLANKFYAFNRKCEPREGNGERPIILHLRLKRYYLKTKLWSAFSYPKTESKF